jgi:signal transduction histidine kinase
MTAPSAPAERAEVARQLHEEVAQTLAGLAYQISAAARDCPDEETRTRLTEMRQIAGDALEQTRMLARAVLPLQPGQLSQPPHGDPLRSIIATPPDGRR